MWNETDTPLAYLITFRCRGTWLHGDDRGSVDHFHNRYKSPYIEPNAAWHRHNTESLKAKSVTLNAVQRQSVESAIQQTCAVRKWHLYAIHVRTNHVHTVVSIEELKRDRALNAFKANATRQMRQDGVWDFPHTPLVRKGSKRYLWNERSVARAIDYVLNGQGDDPPDFDADLPGRYRSRF